MNDDDDRTSKPAIAGSDVPGCAPGAAAKSVGLLTFCVAAAYSAPDGSNVPTSSVDAGAITLRDAPSTDTNSYTLPPPAVSPSTSKTVSYTHLTLPTILLV